ncbi:MAG: 4-hydroxy-tetrahydrodipicolinate synthase [Mariprofundales bacterium]
MFHGTMTAMVTPFNSAGNIDEIAYCAHIERQIAAGIDALVPAGSTGEAATLSLSEHKRLIQLTVECVAGRVPVLAGSGSNSTSEAIELTQAAKDAKADAALIISPYYNKPTQEGVYQHYAAIARAVHMPIILYNVPGRTALNMSPATVARLAEIANIVGLKDATADLEQTSETLNACNGKIELYSGDDATVLPFMALGGAGVISVVANIAPVAMKQLVQAMKIGDLATARIVQQQLLPLSQAMFVQANPIPVKAACSMMGWMDNSLRLPLTVLPPAESDTLAQVMRTYGLLS